jgi:hypothetical protein
MQRRRSGRRSVSGEAACYQCCLRSSGALFLQANDCEVPWVPSPVELETTQVWFGVNAAGSALREPI